MQDLAPADADTPAENLLDAALEQEADEIFEDGEIDAAPQPQPEPSEPPETEGDDAPLDETETDTDIEEEQDADTPADDDGTLEAPARWDAKGKEIWQTYTPEQKQYALAREKVLQGEHTRRQQELAQVRLELETVKTQPDKELSQLIEMQKARVDAYSGVTDAQLMDAVTQGRIDPQQAQQIRQAREDEKAALSQLEDAAAQREAKNLKEHRNREFLKLQAQSPEIATEEGLRAVNAYLAEQGLKLDDMKWMGALEYQLADKARRFDAIQAAKSKSKPAPVKAGKPSPARPANAGDPRAAKMAALRRKNTPEALSELLAMQLSEEADGMFS